MAFGKLTGKRPANGKTGAAGGRVSSPLEIAPQTDKSQTTNGHRRDSSVLSFSELGQNVKRSVSLRSHRSQPSGSSNTFGHKSKSSSSGTPFNTALTTSPIEDDEPPNPLQHTQTSPPQLPKSRGKLSITARNLSTKFSSPSLSTYVHADSLDSTIERPTTAVEVRHLPSSSMLAAPNAQKRGAPERPPLPSSFSIASSNETGTGNTNHNERLYMQSTATPVPYHASTHDPKAVYKTIHETASKRMATIEYLRKVHEGHIFYFSTIHYSPVTLQSIPSMHPLKLGRRATNYFVLGYSLPALLDLNSGSPLEYLRALFSLLQEFEAYQYQMGMDSSGNSLSKGRMQNMFKRGNKPRRSSTAQETLTVAGSEILGLPRSAGSDAVSPMETSPSPISPGGQDFNRLVTPHLPFDPDFTTIYATLCDTLVDTYAKLIDLVSSPDVCSPAVGDWFTKVDKTIRKILMSSVIREFEENTKTTVKTEVAGLGKLVLGGLM